METTTSSSSPQSSSSCTWRSVFRPGLFHGKVALVTGGGTGIGRAIATELAILGATVIIASRNQEQCQQTAREINDSLLSYSSSPSASTAKNSTSAANTRQTEGEKAIGRVLAGPSTSIRNEQQVIDLVAFCIETCGALHLLVNNAGGQFIAAADDLSQRGFAAVVDTNLTGTFLVCREAYTQYMEQHGKKAGGGGGGGGGCAIVNITLGNRNGMPRMSHSGAARAGVENLTATLCTEWIESQVRINCVRPGIVWTESGAQAYGPGVADSIATQLLPSIPAKRFGTPQEVSSAVCWLLSDGASYVTGTVLSVCGGGSYTLLPLVEIENKTHLPHYGELPARARL
jgi:peroxisomal trans-2-enoyl-CoA reductase